MPHMLLEDHREKMNGHKETPVDYLLFGNGWIASQVKQLLLEQGKVVATSFARLENREDVMRDLKRYAPRRVMNFAGVRGLPNADWCEDHKVETARSNVLGVMNLVDCCYLLDIHITHFGSACVYEHDANHPPDHHFTEDDEPFYHASFYSHTRLVSEWAIRHYPNLLILRVRAPIAANLDPNNLLTKLFNYKRILNIPASGTVLPDLLPGAILLAEHGETGIYNLISPQPFTNNEILSLAKKYVHPSLTWENFELEDQKAVLKAPRCNPVFDTTKLVNKLRELGYQVKDTHDALEDMFIKMGEQLARVASFGGLSSEEALLALTTRERAIGPRPGEQQVNASPIATR
ncbi:epimerase/hydratase [Thermothelomyces thermophilus ATCC 42464]|uniref:Epimerase/hydratase n=1 Tax=Thermothelomyces thermophilus (strain ATCC 42464 / BCRC 31852 / DSM 1799) TaxID=573729 RepID=G2QH39_THET4|nr:epimerase/hydratase [Thermothelomyces thermophilus ATCC 42464]AEO58699.1 epimerase/hydratase [Thermothelomyces thermophilus ATCC 42464]